MDLTAKIKTAFIAVFSTLSARLGILYVPFLVLIASNVIDYITGLCAAKYRTEYINSYKSLRGIAKKVCMWLLVAVGAMLDWLMNFAAEQIGISFPLHFLIASVAAVWLIANEIISVLENMNDIGVDLPPFLMKIAANVRVQAEKKADIGTEREDGNGRKGN